MYRPTEQPPIPAELIAEQLVVQEEKNNKRDLNEYTKYIFLGQIYKNTQTSEVEAFIRKQVGRGITDIGGLLRTIHKNINRPAYWVDMGGGHGLAQRQMLIDKKMVKIIHATNVDIIERKNREFNEEEVQYLTKKFPGIFEPETAPDFIQANIENVKLPTPADLITSVEAIQYLNDPLLAISNWYNQLSPNGLVIISTEHSWSNWIRSEGTIFKGEDHPLIPLFTQLESHNIPFSFSQECYPHNNLRPTTVERGFCNLIIKKVPNTKIELIASVKNVWVNPYHYKAVYYEKHPLTIKVIDCKP